MWLNMHITATCIIVYTLMHYAWNCASTLHSEMKHEHSRNAQVGNLPAGTVFTSVAVGTSSDGTRRVQLAQPLRGYMGTSMHGKVA